MKQTKQFLRSLLLAIVMMVGMLVPQGAWAQEECEHEYYYVQLLGGGSHYQKCDKCNGYTETEYCTYDENGICMFCEFQCLHPEYTMEERSHTCLYCGFTESHEWNEGKCDICGYECLHSQFEQDVFDSHKCPMCGISKDHEWDDMGHCFICDYVCQHEDNEGESTWNDGVCRNCGYECRHEDISIVEISAPAIGYDDYVRYSNGVVIENIAFEIECKTCGMHLTQDDSDMAKVTATYIFDDNKPTCTEEGSYSFNAEITVYNSEGLLINSTIVYEVILGIINHFGHDYHVLDENNNLAFVWSEDYTTATLQLVCSHNAEHTANVEVTGEDITSAETTPATCNTAGVRTYTATATYEGETYTDTKEEEIMALGHSFTEYSSNGDATCFADGTKSAKCDNGCGETNTVADEGTKSDHLFGTISEEANSDGLYEKECIHHCGNTIYTIKDALGEGKHIDLIKNSSDQYEMAEDDLVLNDNGSFSSPVNFNVRGSVAYSRLATKDTMSLILPFDVPADRLNGVAYKFTSFDGKDLFFESTDGIQANTPCMLSGIKTLGEPIISAELENVTIKASNPIDVEDATGKSAHFGVYEKSLFECGGHDYYGFKNNQFVKAGIDIEVSPFRAAVRLKKSALRSLSYNPATLGIVFDGNDVTHAADIEQTMTGKVNVHDVTGRILRQNVEAANCTDGLEPGVYVVNGKKVVVTVKE